MNLRDRAPVRLKRQVRSALGVMGVEIGAYTGSFSEHRDHLIRSAEVNTVWDVGANIGQYATAVRRGGYRGRLISIEPGSSAFHDLWMRTEHDNAWYALRTAVAETAGERVLHVTRNSQSSSLLPMLDRHVEAAPSSEVTDQETVTTSTLDELHRDLGAPRPYFLKLDLQGCELSALRGATRFLDDTAACEVELSLFQLYEGAPTWDEVTHHLREAGFSLCDLERVFYDRVSQDLLQVNALFRRVAAAQTAEPSARQTDAAPDSQPPRAA